MKLKNALFASAALAALALPTAAQAGTVEGTVSDASDTIALRSAQVRIVELDRVVATERDGSFLLADVPAGEYTLEISYVGAETVTRTVSVPATGTVRADIAMSGFGDNEILVIGQAANLSSALVTAGRIGVLLEALVVLSRENMPLPLAVFVPGQSLLEQLGNHPAFFRPFCF